MPARALDSPEYRMFERLREGGLNPKPFFGPGSG